MGKNSKPKNAFQIEDPDAPDNTQSIKIVKLKKIIQGEERNITRKIYLLEMENNIWSKLKIGNKY